MVTAVKTKQQQEVDLLLETAHSIETMTQDKALEMVGSIIEESGLSDFRLGGLLGLINTHGWFEEYGSFKGLLKEKFNLEYRKAMYLIGIYNVLVEAQIPWSKVSHLGWTKLKELVKILTADNVDEWVEIAANCTVLQLIDAIKKAKGSATTTKGESDVSTLTFKCHADQKEVIQSALEKAKAELNTEVNTVALENICIAYMGGTVTINVVESGAKASDELLDDDALPTYFKNLGYEKVLQAWEEAFPEMDLTLTIQ